MENGKGKVERDKRGSNGEFDISQDIWTKAYPAFPLFSFHFSLFAIHFHPLSYGIK